MSSFIQTKLTKHARSTLILASTQSYLLEYLKGDMESIYTKLALCGSKKEWARTDTLFLYLSEVSKGTVSLIKSKIG